MRPAFRIAHILLVGAALAAPREVDAQRIPSAYTFIETKQEVGLFAGYVNASPGRFEYGPSGGLWVGGRYGVQLGGPVSVEGVVGLIKGTRDIVNPSRLEGDRKIGEGDVRLTTIEARLRFNATGDRAWHHVSPFLALGAGVAFDLANAPAEDANLQDRDVFDFGTSFLGTLGLGTRVIVSDHVALRADGTFSLWRLKTPPGFSDTDRAFESVSETEWVRGLGVSLALMYRW